MTSNRANLVALIDALIDMTRANIAALDESIRHVRELSGFATGLEGPVEQPVQQPLKTPETRADHRRAHRRGVPSKIDSDPELRAFIIARMDTMKFTEIEAEVRANFPPDRQTSKSALSRWWQREGQYLRPQPQDKGCS